MHAQHGLHGLGPRPQSRPAERFLQRRRARDLLERPCAQQYVGHGQCVDGATRELLRGRTRRRPRAPCRQEHIVGLRRAQRLQRAQQRAIRLRRCRNQPRLEGDVSCCAHKKDARVHCARPNLVHGKALAQHRQQKANALRAPGKAAHGTARLKRQHLGEAQVVAYRRAGVKRVQGAETGVLAQQQTRAHTLAQVPQRPSALVLLKRQSVVRAAPHI